MMGNVIVWLNGISLACIVSDCSIETAVLTIHSNRFTDSSEWFIRESNWISPAGVQIQWSETSGKSSRTAVVFDLCWIVCFRHTFLSVCVQCWCSFTHNAVLCRWPSLSHPVSKWSVIQIIGLRLIKLDLKHESGNMRMWAALSISLSLSF